MFLVIFLDVFILLTFIFFRQISSDALLLYLGTLEMLKHGLCISATEHKSTVYSQPSVCDVGIDESVEQKSVVQLTLGLIIQQAQNTQPSFYILC